jgi:hypothetical protein
MLDQRARNTGRVLFYLHRREKWQTTRSEYIQKSNLRLQSPNEIVNLRKK